MMGCGWVPLGAASSPRWAQVQLLEAASGLYGKNNVTLCKHLVTPMPTFCCASSLFFEQQARPRFTSPHRLRRTHFPISAPAGWLPLTQSLPPVAMEAR